MTTHQLTDFPELAHAVEQARNAGRRMYRTRLKEVNPPAVAGLIDQADLLVTSMAVTSGAQAIFVRLPADWGPSIDALAQAPYDLVVHPDIGLQAQAAYVSLSVPQGEGQLPLALWIEADKLLRVSEHNLQVSGSADVPLVLVAGSSFVLKEERMDEAMRKRIGAALSTTAKKPWARDAAYIEKAQETAKRYGERPWLFMRYELRNAGKRMAVTWAPFPADLPACVQ